MQVLAHCAVLLLDVSENHHESLLCDETLDGLSDEELEIPQALNDGLAIEHLEAESYYDDLYRQIFLHSDTGRYYHPHRYFNLVGTIIPNTFYIVSMVIGERGPHLVIDAGGKLWEHLRGLEMKLIAGIYQHYYGCWVGYGDYHDCHRQLELYLSEACASGSSYSHNELVDQVTLQLLKFQERWF